MSPAASNVSEPLQIGDRVIQPGERTQYELPVARLFTGSWLSLTVAVLHGATPGPKVWLSAALHGDELNGMEIIRQVLRRLDPATLRGSVIAVPVVNVFGLLNQTRYLPDRRDLNRSFPGNAKGSLTARLAHLFLEEVVSKGDYGIDLHTASNHRTNLPQIRADLDDPVVARLSEAFGAPIMFRAPRIRGSLREAAYKRGIRYLLYEAGEPLRLNRFAVEAGVRGVQNVLTALDMIEPQIGAPLPPSLIGGETRWLRASRTGSVTLKARLGDRVVKGQVIGTISDPVSDPFSTQHRTIKAPMTGMVIGYTNNPLVHQGDALVHLAALADESPIDTPR